MVDQKNRFLLIAEGIVAEREALLYKEAFNECPKWALLERFSLFLQSKRYWKIRHTKQKEANQ